MNIEKPKRLKTLLSIACLTFIFSCGTANTVPTETLMEQVDISSGSENGNTVAPTETISAHPFVESGHSVSGLVTTFKNTSTNEYRFELSSFLSQNGPDLHVYLSDDISATNYVDLGTLKSTNGNLVYSASTDQFESINTKYLLIWCRQFSVLFASAKIGE